MIRWLHAVVGLTVSALKHQKKYSEGKEIANSLQTNGTLLDDDWCEFLATNHFLVGLSLDGPEPVHDAYRVDREGKGTSDTVFKSLRRMQRHGVQVNVLVPLCRLQRVSASCGAWNETDVGVHPQRDPRAEDHGNDLIHTQLNSTLAAPQRWSVGRAAAAFG